MRGWIVCGIAAFLLLSGSGAVFARGVCLEATDGCNDYFLELKPLSDSLYSVSGYEYGCGDDRDEVIGTMRLSSGTATFGITGSGGGGFDAGPLYQRNYEIDTVTQSGTYRSFYTYWKANLLRGDFRTGPAVLFACSDPGVPVPGE